ncbi:MAG: hypothetical protein Kow0099_09550 [Candidatus Abyssubacteria bacterium]
MPSVGRNEPCPCGSGKKYKKCCMPKETAVDLQELRRSRAEESLRGEILKFTTGGRFKDEMEGAFQKYHNGKVAVGLLLNQDPIENIRFLDWFIHEHRHSKENKRIIDLFAEQRAKHLDEDQKKLLEEWRASRLGAFEVVSTEGGVLELKDLFGEETCSIKDPSATEELNPGEAVVVRVTSSWGTREMAGVPIKLSPEQKQKFLDSMNAEFEKYRQENPDASMSDFLVAKSHLLIALANESLAEVKT